MEPGFTTILHVNISTRSNLEETQQMSGFLVLHDTHLYRRTSMLII